MKQISSADVHAIKVGELGLDPAALDLAATESLAAAIRRAASFLCPCPHRALVRSVTGPLRGLTDNPEAIEGRVEETLEALLSYGDLIESATELEEGKPSRHLLHAAAPSFVPRDSGATLLVGILSDTSMFPLEIANRIEHVNHVRRMTPEPGEKLAEILLEYGLLELSLEAWRSEPTRMTAAQYVGQLDEALSNMEPSRQIQGLTLLDPEKPVHYYRGRWVSPKKHTGKYVARRSQGFGADLWCYVQMKDGQPERMIDFPIWDSGVRGCDDAWRAQAALDAVRGTSQIFKIRPGLSDKWIIEFYSPVPAWARRRWDAVAEPMAASGCLFAYRITSSELDEEMRFLREALWLSEKV